MTGDYFWTNDHEWTIWGNLLDMRSFQVPRGETLDLHVNVSSHEKGANDFLWIQLWKDGRKIAENIDDGNKRDDNAALQLIYKEKTNPD